MRTVRGTVVSATDHNITINHEGRTETYELFGALEVLARLAFNNIVGQLVKLYLTDHEKVDRYVTIPDPYTCAHWA